MMGWIYQLQVLLGFKTFDYSILNFICYVVALPIFIRFKIEFAEEVVKRKLVGPQVNPTWRFGEIWLLTLVPMVRHGRVVVRRNGY